MTHTIIALLSIVLGILGATLMGLRYSKYTLGFIGNSIAGVFGSVFITKSFGRLGVNPNAILATGETNIYLLVVHALISVLAGVLAVYLGAYLKNKLI
ncbi:MAG: hypothetical protein ACI85Q_000489 [Salibacteraceae bacterium]|jgi:hypothetical protein